MTNPSFATLPIITVSFEVDNQLPERDAEVVGVNKLLTLEIERRHEILRWRGLSHDTPAMPRARQWALRWVMVTDWSQQIVTLQHGTLAAACFREAMAWRVGTELHWRASS